jgi:hypothetical protein
MLIAADRKQAKVLLKYVRAFLDGVPMLRAMVENITAEAIELSNNVVVEVHTASYRSIRGRTVVAAVCDEAAFWRNEESANPDREILAALRPSMSTVPDAMLLVISTPYARRGILWDAFRRNFGKPGDVFVWTASTRVMNPSVPQSFIDNALEEDPASASAEYLAEFRSDVEAYISQEVVDTCVVPGRHELPPVAGTRYAAFCDPSGGSRAVTIAARAGRTSRIQQNFAHGGARSRRSTWP